MTEREPGPLIDYPLTGMEACVRISFVMRLGECAAAADLEEVNRLEQILPDPCSLCPRLTAAGRGPLDTTEDEFMQPAGRPCMFPREILVRALQGIGAYNGHKKTG